MLEAISAIFPLVAQEHVAIADPGPVEVQVIDVLNTLDIHRQAFQPIGELGAWGGHGNTADLLEVGELRHLHPVTPHLPPQTPGAQRRAFPIVLDKAYVVQQRVNADRAVAVQQQRLAVRRAGLQDRLILVVMPKPVRVVAITPIGRPPAGLHVGSPPRLRPERTQRRRRVERPRAHFHVIRLQDDAALPRPKGVQPQDQLLEAWRLVGRHVRHRAASGPCSCGRHHRRVVPEGKDGARA